MVCFRLLTATVNVNYNFVVFVSLKIADYHFMNRYKLRAFGITRELLGGKEPFIEIQGQTVGDLRMELARRYPELLGLKSLYIAVNGDYASEDQVLTSQDEIALIPPVSGG